MKSSSKGVIIAFVLGLPLFIFGVKELYQVNKFVMSGEQANGIVIEVKKGPGQISKYHPRVRFQTKDGKSIEFIPGNGSNPPMYEVNDQVPVVYNSSYPNHAVINSFIEIWLGPVIYFCLGLLLVVYPVFNWLKSKS
jgi:hypothetical protein